MGRIWSHESSDQSIVGCFVKIEMFIIGSNAEYILIGNIDNVVNNVASQTDIFHFFVIFRLY